MKLPGTQQGRNGKWMCVVALLSLTSCIDNPTAPGRRRPLTPNASVSVAGPLGTFTIPIASSNAPPTNGALAEQGTGIFLPDNSTVEITVSGAVHVQRIPGYLGDPNMDEESPLAGRDISPAGVTGQLHVSLNVGSGTAGSDTTTEVWLVRVNTGFELRVSRTGAGGGMSCMSPPAGPPMCQCPTGPCSLFSVPSYVFTSDQVITVNRVDDDVTLSAAAPTGAAGRSVTFTPTSAIPGSPMSWTWTPDSGSAQTIACSYGANPCVTNVYESGWMDVAYFFPPYNGTQLPTRHAKVHVTTVDCPTGDSTADDPTNRSLLANLWLLSGADSASLPMDGRREHGGYSFGTQNDPFQVSTFRISPADPRDTPCSNFNQPGAYGTLVPLLSAHVHPFSIGDSLPTTCIANYTPGDVITYSYGYGGFSGADWNRMFDDQLPSMVMDRDSIYIAFPPDSIRWIPNPNVPADSLPIPVGSWQSRVRALPRHYGNCTIL